MMGGEKAFLLLFLSFASSSFGGSHTYKHKLFPHTHTYNIYMHTHIQACMHANWHVCVCMVCSWCTPSSHHSYGFLWYYYLLNKLTISYQKYQHSNKDFVYLLIFNDILYYVISLINKIVTFSNIIFWNHLFYCFIVNIFGKQINFSFGCHTILKNYFDLKVFGCFKGLLNKYVVNK